MSQNSLIKWHRDINSYSDSVCDTSHGTYRLRKSLLSPVWTLFFPDLTYTESTDRDYLDFLVEYHLSQGYLPDDVEVKEKLWSIEYP